MEEGDGVGTLPRKGTDLTVGDRFSNARSTRPSGPICLKTLFLYRFVEFLALRTNMMVFERGQFLDRYPVEYVIWTICQ